MKKAITLIFVWLSWMLLSQAQSVAKTPPKRPNLILVVTDDLDARLPSTLPKLRALLADKGTTFTNAFVTTPVCCPSRASILRGQYAHNHRVRANQLPDGGFQKFYDLGLESSTIATWLQAAGYKTVLIGKYLNDYPRNLPARYVPPGWDEWYAKVSGQVYFNFRLNENGKIVQYGAGPDDYLTDVQAKFALDFIQRHVSGEQPFFMYLAPTTPHNEVVLPVGVPIPPVSSPRHENEFAGVKAPRVPSFNEEVISDKPIWLRGSFPLLDADGISIVDEYYRKRLQSMLAVEELIDNLIMVLEKADAMKNTYIFFTSDNGFHMGEHRLPPQKCTPYEEDIRVPLLVRGPGVPAGRTLDQIVLNIDLAPTLAELAGIQAPEFVDGRSLAPLLNGNFAQVPAWRKAFLVEYWQLPALPFPTYQAIRTLDCKYVEWSIGDRELYELFNDPFELYSLHRQASPQLMNSLSSELFRLSLCVGDSCNRAVDLKLHVCCEPVPEEIALYQNYPNPFNAATIIRYALKQPAHVKLKLFDIHGGEVMTLVDEPQPAGLNSIPLNSATLSSGVYFYRLSAGAFEETKKLVIIK